MGFCLEFVGERERETKGEGRDERAFNALKRRNGTKGTTDAKKKM